MQKTVTIQNKEWTLNECQKVPGLWITEIGCQKSRIEAERWAQIFHFISPDLLTLNRVFKHQKLWKIFMCGNCPKYGGECEHFDEVRDYTVQIQEKAAKEIGSIKFDPAVEEYFEEDLPDPDQFIFDDDDLLYDPNDPATWEVRRSEKEDEDL